MKNLNFGAHSAQRVAVFIDTQNLYHSARSNYRANVNYQELLNRAVSERQLVRAFAYVIKSEEGTEEKFHEAIEELGIEIRIKDLQVFHTGAKKADWDVGIAVDMIRLTEKVDVIVLASGDGDFLEVMRYCQSRGVRVEIMAFDKTTNAKLMDEADLFTDLGDKKNGFLISGKTYNRAKSGYGNSKPSSNIQKTQNSLNLPAFYRQERGQTDKIESGLGEVSNQSRIVSSVFGLPARPARQNITKARVRRRISVRDMTTDNVFGNKRPRRKKANEVKRADEQVINWFGTPSSRTSIFHRNPAKDK